MQLRDIRSPPSLGNLRAKGGGGGGGKLAGEVEPLSEEQTVEMERLLSDALTRADFASSLSDRDVLKALLKDLTPTQQGFMARIPRERLLTTVAAHRESHRVAHEALSRLGSVLTEYAGAELGTLDDAPSASAAEAEAASAAEAEAEAVRGARGPPKTPPRSTAGVRRRGVQSA